jgi:hypothetical protein
VANAKEEAQQWTEAVTGLAAARNLKYEPVGGINPLGAPAALCPGGTNRLTGQLATEFWGASCDADEHEAGGFGRKAVLPDAVMAKSHMPELASVVPVFFVESLDANAEDRLLDSHSRRRVEFESIEFNKHYIATVPTGHDPVALRELFSPAFIDWTTRIDRPVEFGINDAQFFFHWKLREHTREELEAALAAAGGIFKRLQLEMAEDGIGVYEPGPWHAGLEPFPAAPGAPAPQT